MKTTIAICIGAWLAIAFLLPSCGVPVTVDGQLGTYQYSAKGGLVIHPKYPVTYGENGVVIHTKSRQVVPDK